MKAVEATVGEMQSTDKTVHLKVDDDTNGNATVDDRGFAIAAACRVAKKKVWLTYTSFTAPKGKGEVGTFSGVELGTDDFTD